MNLACSDFIMMAMIPLLLYNCYHFGPALGSTGCKFYGFLGGFSGTVSICLLAAISLDRYQVIKYPLTRQPSFTRVKILITCCWIYGSIFSIIPVLDIGLGTYVPEAYLVSCSYDYLTKESKIKYFIFSFFVAAWIIPFLLILFSYISIIHVVLVGQNTVANSAFNDSYKHTGTQEKVKQEVKVAFIVLAVIILWFIAWTPYAIVSLLGIFDRGDLITPLGSMIPAVFCKTASCIDPYIYALSHPRFKQEIQNIFCKSVNTNTNVSKPYTITMTNYEKVYEYDRDSVIEDTIVVDLNNYSLDNSLSNISKKSDKALQTCVKHPPWWAKPSFNDRSGLPKARKLAKSISVRKSISIENEHEEEEYVENLKCKYNYLNAT